MNKDPVVNPRQFGENSLTYTQNTNKHKQWMEGREGFAQPWDGIGENIINFNIKSTH